MTDIGTRARSAVRNRNAVIVAGLIVLTLIYPQIYDSLSSLPLIGDFVPKTDALVVMVAFTTMAVGLNIVVGYAGLLDLGYVAFYAVGAYTAGWFASQQFDQRQFHFGSVGVAPTIPGIHISMWLVLPVAGLLTLVAGILIGLPTLRLRGDYLAIVTLGFGEIVPQFVRNADDRGGSTSRTGPSGSRPSTRSASASFLPGSACPRASASPPSAPSGTSGPRSRSCSSPSSAACGCATRGSAAPGSRSARTRPRPPRWVCR